LKRYNLTMRCLSPVATVAFHAGCTGAGAAGAAPESARHPVLQFARVGIPPRAARRDGTARTRDPSAPTTAMHRSLQFLAVAALPAALAAQDIPDGPPPVRATFALIDSTGGRIGQVTALQDPGGVVLQVLATRLAPGPHGMHLHAAPACEPPGFLSAAGHYNPAARKHGRDNPDGPHAGDLPNLEVQPDGSGRAQLRLEGVTLMPGPRSIGVPGTALVIHAAKDDGVTDPTGNAGARLACAVIGVAAAP